MTVRVERARRARFGERDISGLIRIYEACYIRLLKLVPDPAGCDRVMTSRVAGASDLHLALVARQPYTTSLVLTYRFADDVLEPNARINVYHDVRAAELVSHRRRRRRCGEGPWIAGRMPELERKWRMNCFLFKWLKFCTYQGHIFIPGITPALDGYSPTRNVSSLPSLHRPTD